MDNVKMSWWQRHRPSTRRLVQLYSALLYNAHLKGFIDGEIYQGKLKVACVPGFNCYSCPGAIGACPLGSIQNALAASGHQAGWYVLGILSLFGVILGRTICGWLCPLGLIQELLHKIPTPKIKKSRITRALSWLKYVVLAVFVVAIPLWYGLKKNLPIPSFCKYICPAGTFEGAMGLLSNPANTEKFSMLGILFTRKFVIMLIIGLLCVFIYRSFCRFLCPLGAIYGLFNRFNVIGVKVDEDRCNHCGSCVRNCGMDVRHVGDHECINCAKCMEACNQKAISIKAGSYTLKAPKGGCADDAEHSEAGRRHFGRLLWGVALGLLCVALLWYNFLDPSVRKRVPATPAPTPAATAVSAAEVGSPAEGPAVEVEAPAPVSFESSAPVGYEVGQQLADFTAATFDGGEFHLADNKGKIVFINLWGTYCTPCVQELPSFEALFEKHPDELAMLAVHSSLTGEVEPQDYVKEKGWDGWMLPFTLDDEDNDTIFTVVNGSTTLPQTIVLNRRGEVIYNRVGSVTPEMLDALYRQADESAPGGTPAVAAAPAEAAAPVSFESSAPIGYEVGQQLADFTAATFDGGEFRLADTRGKIVFINLWGTYCTPCVQELPSFEALFEQHPDEVAMLAVHSSLTGEVEPQDYVVEKGWDGWMLPFTLDDEDNDTIFTVVNGSTTLPQTIVLNRRGEVIYNRVGSVTPEMLDALYRQADESAPGGAPAVAAAPAEAPAKATEEAVSVETEATEAMESSTPAVYQVIVTDEAGQPVPGTTVQFCSDTECVLGKTDADGIAAFGSEAGTYTIHIQKVPEGYVKDKTEYLAPEEPGPVTVVLKADSAAVAEEQPVDVKDDDFYVIDRPYAGFHFVVPEKYRNLKGSLSINSHTIDVGVLQTTTSYYAFPAAEFDAYNAYYEAWFNAMLKGEDPPEAANPLWVSGCESVYLYDYFVINGDRGEEELRASLKENNGVRGDSFLWLEKIGSNGEFSYFIGQYSELDEFMDNCRAVIGEEYYNELEELVTDRETYLNALTPIVPVVDSSSLEIGDVVSFETTDLDGNPVNSKDLFAERKVTMINLWATWCFACKREMPELSELAKEFEEMDCQIVGICTDADEEDMVELAKEILRDNGVEYLNLAALEDIDKLLPAVSYPTSFFFDSEGRMVVEPVRGAFVEQYLPTLNAALEKIGGE